MIINTCVCTDKGIVKPINQDANTVCIANSSEFGRICFASVCDGMGGLSSGEKASAFMVRRMEEWFRSELPRLLRDDTGEDITSRLDSAHVIPENERILGSVRKSWDSICMEQNQSIKDYGLQNHISLGTTAVSILLMDGRYLIMNVGDSRVFASDGDKVSLLTHDQSYVQREIDRGRMTADEAKVSAERSVLLQCIGASENVVPDFYTGSVDRDIVFLICTDGFWRLSDPAEIDELTSPDNWTSDIIIQRRLSAAVDKLKENGEKDNITAVLIKCRVNE